MKKNIKIEIQGLKIQKKLNKNSIKKKQLHGECVND